MTDAQTEARAIALDVYNDAVDSDDGSHSMDMNVATGIIAIALAAKDAELAIIRGELNDCASEIHDLRAQIERAEAQLAEARKALGALDRMSRGVDWCDQDEQARRWEAARRALEAQGGENGQ